MDFVIFAFCAIILAMLIRSKRAFNRVFSNPYVNVCKYTTVLSNLKLINSVSIKKIRKESSDRILDQMMREVKITLVNDDVETPQKRAH